MENIRDKKNPPLDRHPKGRVLIQSLDVQYKTKRCKSSDQNP